MPVDTDSDHFDRRLVAANGDGPTDENAPPTTCVTGRTPSALEKEPLTRGPKSTIVRLGIWGIELPTTAVQVLIVITNKLGSCIPTITFDAGTLEFTEMICDELKLAHPCRSKSNATHGATAGALGYAFRKTGTRDIRFAGTSGRRKIKAMPFKIFIGEATLINDLSEGTLNALLRGVASPSLNEIDRLIHDLENVREILCKEGERITREIIDYASLSRASMSAMKVISKCTEQWQDARADIGWALLLNCFYAVTEYTSCFCHF